MRSVGTLIRTEPLLRRRALSQALMFGAFICYWTTITYELIDHHGLSQREIGVFALVGAAGALRRRWPVGSATAGYGRVLSGSGTSSSGWRPWSSPGWASRA